MDKAFFTLMDDIIKKINRQGLKNKEKYVKDIEDIKERYKSIEVQENRKETYDSIIKIGKDLLKEDKDFKKRLEIFIRYCNAAIYDFNGDLKPLRRLVLSYMISCTLFMVLSPQYLSYMLPILMIIPIFLGIRGIKKRLLNGLTLGVSVLPMCLLTSTIIIRNAFNVSNNFESFALQLAQQYNRSVEFVKTLFIGSTILGIILLFSSIYTIYLAYKYRKMFV